MTDTVQNTPSEQVAVLPQKNNWVGRLIFTVIVAGLIGGAAWGIWAVQQSFLQELIVEAPMEPAAPTTPTSSRQFALKAAPDFTLESTKGISVHFYELRGKPVVLLFFAGWNEASLDGLRTLNAASARLADAGITIFAIDSLETLETAGVLAGRMGLEIPLFADSVGDVGEAYHITTLPSFFFIDADGMLKEQNIGPLSIDEILAKALIQK